MLPNFPTRAPGFTTKGLPPSIPTTTSIKDQPISSQPGPFFSSISGKHFVGELPIEKETESNILVKGENWVIKEMTELKENELFTMKEDKSLGF